MDDVTKLRKQNLAALIAGKPYLGNQAAFATASGLTRGRVSQLLDPNESFGERAAQSLCEKMRLKSGYFEKAISNETVIQSGTKIADDENDVVIPQYDTGGAMGGGLVLQDQPGVIKKWHVSDDWLRLNVHRVTSTKNLAIVTGFGDSMRGMYNPGDPLLVDTGVRSVDFDAVYFFRVENEGFVKRLQRIPGEGILVISENKAYRDWTIKPGADFEVFARVVKVWESQDF